MTSMQVLVSHLSLGLFAIVLAGLFVRHRVSLC
jgi:hypothetical protein